MIHFRLLLALSFVWGSLCAVNSSARAAENAVKNGSFAQKLASWQLMGNKANWSVAKAGGQTALEYTSGVNRNDHADQMVNLQAGSVYLLTFSAKKNDDSLDPGVRIADADWQTITYAKGGGVGRWETCSVQFAVDKTGEYRVQLFGAGYGQHKAVTRGKSWFTKVTLAKSEIELQAVVTVEPRRKLADLHQTFFGVNTLFWIDDDASWRDGTLVKMLSDARCGLMRFPGGEVADNYIWKTNRLNDTKAYPYRDGPETMDCDEFMVHCRKIGAEPIFVVNADQCFIDGDIDGGIAQAVEWLKHLKSQGEKVTWWEIGNECYLKGSRFPFSARQYAELVVKFSQAMREVDPNIKIGAVGPHANFDGVVWVDTIKPEHLGEFQQLAKGQRGNWRTMEEWSKGKTREDGDAWWPTVCKVARGHFDFMIIHIYDRSREEYRQQFTPALKLADLVGELRKSVSAAIGQETIPIALTEWNTGPGPHVKLNVPEHAMTVAEEICEYLKAGVEMGNLWPMRGQPEWYKRKPNRCLLYADNTPAAEYLVFRAFSANAGTKVLESTANHPELFTLASSDPQTKRLVVWIGNRNQLKEISTTLQMPGRVLSANVLTAGELPEGMKEHQCEVTGASGEFTVSLPPLSLTTVVLEQ